MTTDEPRSGLPVEFLLAIAAEAGPGSPPIRMALEKARDLPEGTHRDDLLLALLRGALSGSAPEWMLKAAADSGLKEEVQPYGGSPLSLARVALTHPSCPDSLREEALRRCTVAQLGALGHEGCGEALAAAVVSELKDRCPHRQPMTPELLEEPCVSQLILREPRLHDAVFFAALGLLPEFPQLPAEDESEEDGDLTRYDRFWEARKAWEGTWEHIVTMQTGRHHQLIDWAPDSRSRTTIRDHLLGTVPWDVEPSLLEEMASEDLAGFAVSDLITRLCGMLRDGIPEYEARSRIAVELDALKPEARERTEDYFNDVAGIRKYGLRAAASWVASRADGSWRYILTPSEAKTPYGKSRDWLASEKLLATLGGRFAATAVKALHLWEPDPGPLRPSPRDLRWLHAALLHLPHVTEEVKEKARAVIRHVRPSSRSPWEHLDYKTQQGDQRLAELRTAIERILGDPAAVSRGSALGDPDQVTARELARASDEVLGDYLTRHAGDDALVELALLSFATSSYRSKPSFSEVLSGHSSPEAALAQITTDLRKRLGGGPHLREAWTRQVLALPDLTPELVRALPAWTALTVGGPRYGTAHEAVASVVLAALGDSGEAWSRFAASPASYSGPTAWLRLGDVLDAAAKETDWPTPPNSK
ncbi:hypothetical protein [Streptomyces aurantiacus]|uniref:hypothetical protein n=1 Tax=Streptomyces aurantiacus TaxID=47760 RepID=UPI0006E32333|nr:hypothetical protein [Streptomyces aurantiacus]